MNTSTLEQEVSTYETGIPEISEKKVTNTSGPEQHQIGVETINLEEVIHEIRYLLENNKQESVSSKDMHIDEKLAKAKSMQDPDKMKEEREAFEKLFEFLHQNLGGIKETLIAKTDSSRKMNIAEDVDYCFMVSENVINQLESSAQQLEGFTFKKNPSGEGFTLEMDHFKFAFVGAESVAGPRNSVENSGTENLSTELLPDLPVDKVTEKVSDKDKKDQINNAIISIFQILKAEPSNSKNRPPSETLIDVLIKKLEELEKLVANKKEFREILKSIDPRYKNVKDQEVFGKYNEDLIVAIEDFLHKQMVENIRKQNGVLGFSFIDGAFGGKN